MSSRKILLTILLFCIFATCAWAEERGNEYQIWFDSFIKRFNESFTPLTTTDKRELNDLIQLKPPFNSGQYYNLWFVKCFCKFVEDTSPVLNTGEIEKFEVVFQAMPDLENSGQYYSFYLDYVLKNLDDFMPVLNDAKKKYLEYFLRAKPHSLESDYQKWMSEYTKRKSDYGSIVSEDEKVAIKFLTDVKPTTGEVGGTCVVQRETLLKIRNLILNQQPNSAVAEIDKILNTNQ
ncbi:MAG: hypothetical protein HQM08_21430 [Candidatus Riflebacteria bacterium]|nr:hypothetical protein [Candidatus Riflebacteria bacterium]